MYAKLDLWEQPDLDRFLNLFPLLSRRLLRFWRGGKNLQELIQVWFAHRDKASDKNDLDE